jgi:hypothetical protein
MTSLSTSSSSARVARYPADLTERSYPTTASDRVNAYTVSLHIGLMNWVPPPNIIFPPSLNSVPPASHLSTPSGPLDSDHISVSNARKRTAEDAGMDDADDMGSDFEDENESADVLALDQGREAVLETDGKEICLLNNASTHCTHGSCRLWTTCLANRSLRDTTTRMSARDKNTISSVYAVFLGLQNSVRQHIKSASAGMSARLQVGLIGAHEKLAEYFKESDTSPFYMWAACEWSFNRLLHIS